jgi:hypothetical protein
MGKDIETRKLYTKLTDEEQRARGSELADATNEAARIRGEKKAAMSVFNGKIEEQEERAGRLAIVVHEKAELRDVECRWIPVFKLGHEFLIRLDTKEAIQKRALPKQASIGDADAKKAAEKLLKSLGLVIKEDEGIPGPDEPALGEDPNAARNEGVRAALAHVDINLDIERIKPWTKEQVDRVFAWCVSKTYATNNPDKTNFVVPPMPEHLAKALEEQSAADDEVPFGGPTGRWSAGLTAAGDRTSVAHYFEAPTVDGKPVADGDRAAKCNAGIEEAEEGTKLPATRCSKCLKLAAAADEEE